MNESRKERMCWAFLEIALSSQTTQMSHSLLSAEYQGATHRLAHVYRYLLKYPDTHIHTFTQTDSYMHRYHTHMMSLHMGTMTAATM